MGAIPIFIPRMSQDAQEFLSTEERIRYSSLPADSPESNRIKETIQKRKKRRSWNKTIKNILITIITGVIVALIAGGILKIFDTTPTTLINLQNVCPSGTEQMSITNNETFRTEIKCVVTRMENSTINFTDDKNKTFIFSNTFSP